MLSLGRGKWLLAFVVVACLLALGAAPTSAQDGEPEPTTTTAAPTTVVETTTTSAPVATTTTTGPGPATSSTTDPDDDEDPDDEDPDATTTTTGPTGPDTPLPPRPTYDPNALAELLASYDEAVAEHAELLAQFELSVAELDQLNADMVELSQRITTVEQELLGAQTDLAEAEGRVNTAQVRLADIEGQLADAQDLLDDQAVDAYIYGGRNPAFYALLNAETADEVETSRTYAQAVVEDTDQAIDEYALLEIEAEQLREDAQAAADEAEAARDEVAARRNALADERERRAQAQADAFIAAIAQKGLIEQVEAQREDYEARLRGLSGSSDSINSALKRSQEGQELPATTTGILLPPVESPNLGSPFGPRLHPIFGTVRMHNGLDINAAMGEPLRAAADGEIVVAAWQGGYGNTIVIDHGNGIATLYAHMSSMLLDEGDRVRIGDIIGLAGSTGWSTGPHVHWEVRVFGNPTDPVPFMGGEELLVFREATEDPADRLDPPRPTTTRPR